MKARWAGILAIGLLLVPVRANDAVPSPELLELLGLFSVLEELGVDVEQQINSQEAPDPLPPLEPQQRPPVPGVERKP